MKRFWLLPLILLSSVSHTTAIFAVFDCVGSRAFRSTRGARIRDCAQALLVGFPHVVDISLFHSDLIDDLYRLPRSYTYGECRITVSLTGRPVWSSWQAVWTMATTLSTACLYRTDLEPLGVTAGTVSSGPGSGLTITMERTDAVMSNDSVAAE